CFTTAEEQGNAVPVVPVTSSLREVTKEGNQAADRTRYRLVQTPQCFRVSLLREAFSKAGDASYTDEAGLVEATGHPIHLVDGETHNLKVTEPLDLRVAALLLGGRL
ncbi:MAG: 2-C-methyl-D-erythritol 4-phosphate cytidylyltransferase, partial [Flavobacteriales bacterium]|nr:2-C-methyl-D-erythritol 4-phosphate cytidylyltransferase [Flavobacteriales bacterium]